MPVVVWRPNPFTLLSFGVLLVDQAFDLLIESALPEGASRLLVFGQIGIARPIGSGGETWDTNVFFILLTIAAVPFLWWYMHHTTPDTLYRVAATILLGGLLGNLADGLRVEHPADYLYAGVSFNLADVALVLGGALLLYRVILRPLRGLQEE